MAVVLIFISFTDTFSEVNTVAVYTQVELTHPAQYEMAFWLDRTADIWTWHSRKSTDEATVYCVCYQITPYQPIYSFIQNNMFNQIYLYTITTDIKYEQLEDIMVE